MLVEREVAIGEEKLIGILAGEVVDGGLVGFAGGTLEIRELDEVVSGFTIAQGGGGGGNEVFFADSSGGWRSSRGLGEDEDTGTNNGEREKSNDDEKFRLAS